MLRAALRLLLCATVAVTFAHEDSIGASDGGRVLLGTRSKATSAGSLASYKATAARAKANAGRAAAAAAAAKKRAAAKKSAEKHTKVAGAKAAKAAAAIANAGFVTSRFLCTPSDSPQAEWLYAESFGDWNAKQNKATAAKTRAKSNDELGEGTLSGQRRSTRRRRNSTRRRRNSTRRRRNAPTRRRRHAPKIALKKTSPTRRRGSVATKWSTTAMRLCVNGTGYVSDQGSFDTVASEDNPRKNKCLPVDLLTPLPP